jgi:hypothetical protein
VTLLKVSFNIFIFIFSCKSLREDYGKNTEGGEGVCGKKNEGGEVWSEKWGRKGNGDDDGGGNVGRMREERGVREEWGRRERVWKETEGGGGVGRRMREKGGMRRRVVEKGVLAEK